MKVYGIIYMITNLVTQERYIGQDSKGSTVEQILNNNYLGSSKYLKKDVELLGEEWFHKSLLDIAHTTKELEEKERFWIKYYNTFKGAGYNRNSGGKCFGDTRGENHSQYGLYGDLAPKSIGVLKYDLEGNFLEKFGSCISAANSINIHPSKITSCCKFNRVRTGGYMWFYENTDTDIINLRIQIQKSTKSTLSKDNMHPSCKKYTINGNTYNSLKHACEELNLSHPTIRKRVNSSLYPEWIVSRESNDI